MRSVNHYLVKNGLVPEALSIKCELKKPRGSDRYCFKVEEVAAMLKLCSDNAAMSWIYSVILGLSRTGMRIGELAATRWSDIDLEHGFLTVADERGQGAATGDVRTTKGKRTRRIPLHDELRSHLSSLPRKSDGLVWHSVLGHRLESGNFRQQFVRDVIVPLSPQFAPRFVTATPHSFRHFFCSQAFANGVPEGTIREWLGHADSKIVELYRHLGDLDARRHMDRLEFTARHP
jgi:integrase